MLFSEGMNFLQVTNINHITPESMGVSRAGCQHQESRLFHWHSITFLLTLWVIAVGLEDCKWSVKRKVVGRRLTTEVIEIKYAGPGLLLLSSKTLNQVPEEGSQEHNMTWMTAMEPRCHWETPLGWSLRIRKIWKISPEKCTLSTRNQDCLPNGFVLASITY